MRRHGRARRVDGVDAAAQAARAQVRQADAPREAARHARREALIYGRVLQEAEAVGLGGPVLADERDAARAPL